MATIEDITEVEGERRILEVGWGIALSFILAIDSGDAVDIEDIENTEE